MLYAGETLCFVLYRNPLVHRRIQIIRIPCIHTMMQGNNLTHRKKQKTNRNDDAKLAVKPVTSSSRVSVASSRVSVASCAVTMDNLHHLTGCSGQSSL